MAAFAATCSIEAASRAAGVARSAVYRWLTDDPTFRAEVDEIIAGIVNEAHGMMLRQARDDPGPAGVESRKVLLRAHMPETFAPGLVLRHQLLKLSIEEKRQQLGVTIDGKVVNGNGPMIYPRASMERPMTAVAVNDSTTDTTLGLAVWIDAFLELFENAEENDGP